jgi:hypothetical protein
MRGLGDRDEILRACAALFAPGQVVELRALDAVTPKWPRPHTVAGYFDDWDRLASAAATLSARGVYITLNPLNAALLSRAANRVADVGPRDPLSADADVLARRWLPVDLDPARPAGVSASHEEHALAAERAGQVRLWLAEQGWPDPLLADSGNGAHLLYRVHLPAADEGLVARALAALAARFDDAAVKVDQKVCNPARIWKLYGTLARKGDDTPQRPHRLSRIIYAPGEMGTVPRELLEGLAGRASSTTKRIAARARGDAFDLAAWIERHGLDVAGPREWQGGRKWVFRVCPWNAAHTDRSAFIVERADGAIAAGCQHDSCRGNDWRSLRRLVEGPRGQAPTGPDLPAYFVEGGRMWRRWFSTRADGEPVETSRKVIADFAVRIVGETRAEDGGVAFTVAGETVDGRAVRVTLPVEEFVTEKGLLAGLTAAAGAVSPVYAGMAGCLRPAIQALSADPPVVRLFNRTGWAEIDGARRFLMPGREVAGVEVRLRMLPYQAPRGTGARGDARAGAGPSNFAPSGSGAPAGPALERALAGFRALLRSLDPERTTVVAAMVFGAPLARPAGWASDRCAVFIAGRTGSLKTSFSQALMSLYGAGFGEDQHLLKFGEGATRNALLSYAEQARDLPLLIDNYKPNTGDGARGLVNLLHNLIEGSGRERLNRYSELQEARPIGCWPLLTGEDAPRGDAAALARLLVVPVRWARGDGPATNEALSEAQAAAAHFPLLGAAWLDWLESDAGLGAAARAAAAFPAARAKWARLISAQPSANPLRLATNLATNELAWHALGEHPLFVALAAEFAPAHAAGLALLASEMARQTAENVEAARFVDVLQQLLASGACRLARRGEDREGEDVIGWHAPDGGAYLLPDLARRAVEVALGGEGLNRVSNEALYGQLEEMGLIGSRDPGRRTKMVRTGSGRSVRVLHLTPAGAGAPEDAKPDV